MGCGDLKIQELVIRQKQAPGDVLAATAAVRELHRNYPGKFATAVDTDCPELWENNPLVVDRCELQQPRVIDIGWNCGNNNEEERHYIHHVCGDLGRKLGLHIHVAKCWGDIYLSQAERESVAGFIGWDGPFALIMPGGKTDMRVKIWRDDYYQNVVDYFAGKIKFVQVGRIGAAHGGTHINPNLNSVISMVGKTGIRDLIRLIHHAQLVVSGVTLAAHLAACVPMPNGGRRPAVTICRWPRDGGVSSLSNLAVYRRDRRIAVLSQRRMLPTWIMQTQ